MMSLESHAPGWEWYYIATYFFFGGISAGSYFIGSLVELLGNDKQRQISRIAFYIAFPLIFVSPLLLIADLGQPLRFWHLLLYSRDGLPYMNSISPMSVGGAWALLIYGGISFLSFLNNLVVDGYLRSELLIKLFERIPHKVYAVIGSFFGFFIAGYTGVLLNATARPLWASTDPLIGSIFITSAASTGAAAIALIMAWRNKASGETFMRLETFDRIAMIAELALIVLMVIVAGQYANAILRGWYGVMFLGGTVVLGILIPLGLNWYARKPGAATNGLVVLTAVLILFGGALLRVSLLQAGQM
jgi:polysulfide reductase chain C